MANSILGKLLSSLPENNKLERIWILAKTDFKKRYYGSYLGIFWAFLNPLIRLITYYVVFTIFFNNQIENYVLYIFSGLLLWMFFSESTKKGLTLLQSKRYLYENITIDKTDIFYASLISSCITLVFNYIVYFAISIFFPITYNTNLLFLPLFILNLCILILGINYILSILNLYLRDINHLWDMLMLILFWANPIFYSKEILFEKLSFLLYVNPIAGIIINVREVLIYDSSPYIYILIINFLSAFIIYIIGHLVFNKHSIKAAELV